MTRTLLSADTQFFVSTGGNDANAGTQASPFATLQGGWDKVADTYDAGGKQVALVLGPGTFGPLVTAKGIIGCNGPDSVNILGAGIGKTIISGGQSACFSFGKANAGLSQCTVHDMTLTADVTSTNAHGFSVVGGGCALFYYDIEFGPCGGFQAFAAHDSFVMQLGACTISGGALSHEVAMFGANLATHLQTLQFTAPVHYNSAFAWALGNGAMLPANGMSFIGASQVTGARYIADKGGMIDTGGIGDAYFPGNLPGVVNTPDGALLL